MELICKNCENILSLENILSIECPVCKFDISSQIKEMHNKNNSGIEILNLLKNIEELFTKITDKKDEQRFCIKSILGDIKNGYGIIALDSDAFIVNRCNRLTRYVDTVISKINLIEYPIDEFRNILNSLHITDILKQQRKKDK